MDACVDDARRAIDARDRDAFGAALAQLESQVEHVAGRRQQGIFFTAPDVTRYIVAWCVCHAVADQLLNPQLSERLDAAIASGEDGIQILVRHLRQLSGKDVEQARAAISGLVILDPTCGGGAFLMEAVRCVSQLAREVDAEVQAEQFIGCDIREAAVLACRQAVALELAWAGHDYAHALHTSADTIWVADATRTLAPPRTPTVVVGNPPYVRAPATSADPALRSRACRNLCAWVLEQALAAAQPGARTGFVVPVSTICTDAFQTLRDVWDTRFTKAWVSHYDTIPSTLFAGIVQRLSIVLGQLGDEGRACEWHTTGFRKWSAKERDSLFTSIRYTDASEHRLSGSLAKIGTSLERALLDTLFMYEPISRWHAANATESPQLWYKRRWSYFLLFVNFIPAMFDADGNPREPTEFKPIPVAPGSDPRVMLALYNSSLFYWFFTVFGDNRNVNRREIAGFPVPDFSPNTRAVLGDLADELMETLHANSELRTCTYRTIGTIRNTYFRQGPTKPLLDRIDACLAEAYGMTAEQLDFVCQFESAYRLAR